MTHVRTTEGAPNGAYFEQARRRPCMRARTAGWTVIRSKDRTRTASQSRTTPQLLDARGFAKMLANELKSSQTRRKSFAVLLLDFDWDEMHGADASSILAESIDGPGTRRCTAAKLGPDKLGVMLRDVDAKSAALVSQEICVRLKHLGFDSVDVDGGVFPDDVEMLRGLGRALAR